MTTAIRRRSLLTGTLALAATQAACSSEPSNPRDAATPTTPSTPTTSATAELSESSSSYPSDGARVLVAYFSRAGENYYYGDRTDLEVGNTEVLARLISRRLRELGVEHDVHEIQAADSYSDDYDDTVARNVREQDADARPGIANPLDSIGGYDTVLLASPIWNVRPPMIMHTFADGYDWVDKSVHPVTTYAMSGLGTTEREYVDACRGATIGEGLAVQGEKVRDNGPPAVADWLDRINLT